MKLKITLFFAVIFLSLGYREITRATDKSSCETGKIYFVCDDKIEKRMKNKGVTYRVSDAGICRHPIFHERGFPVLKEIRFYGGLFFKSIESKTSGSGILNLPGGKITSENIAFVSLELKLMILTSGDF